MSRHFDLFHAVVVAVIVVIIAFPLSQLITTTADGRCVLNTVVGIIITQHPDSGGTSTTDDVSLLMYFIFDLSFPITDYFSPRIIQDRFIAFPFWIASSSKITSFLTSKHKRVGCCHCRHHHRQHQYQTGKVITLPTISSIIQIPRFETGNHA